MRCSVDRIASALGEVISTIKFWPQCDLHNDVHLSRAQSVFVANYVEDVIFILRFESQCDLHSDVHLSRTPSGGVGNALPGDMDPHS